MMGKKTKRWFRGVMAVLLLAMSAQAGAQGQKAVARPWKAGTVVSAAPVKDGELAGWFSAQPVPDEVFARMQGKSYPEDCRVARSSLRYLRLLHYDYDGKVRRGEMVCHVSIADDVVQIFKTLYLHRYAIHSIRLIDDFDASDERAMTANNTSSFCYRTVAGSRKLSAHAQGKAVDLNPLYNPYYRRMKDGREVVQPARARAYCNRSKPFPYKIDRQDLAYRLFVKHGFKWGGSWKTVKDYQHFEK